MEVVVAARPPAVEVDVGPPDPQAREGLELVGALVECHELMVLGRVLLVVIARLRLDVVEDRCVDDGRPDELRDERIAGDLLAEGDEPSGLDDVAAVALGQADVARSSRGRRSGRRGDRPSGRGSGPSGRRSTSARRPDGRSGSRRRRAFRGGRGRSPSSRLEPPPGHVEAAAVAQRVVEADGPRPVLRQEHALHERDDGRVEGAGLERGRPEELADTGVAVLGQDAADEVLVFAVEPDEEVEPGLEVRPVRAPEARERDLDPRLEPGPVRPGALADGRGEPERAEVLRRGRHRASGRRRRTAGSSRSRREPSTAKSEGRRDRRRPWPARPRGAIRRLRGRRGPAAPPPAAGGSSRR